VAGYGELIVIPLERIRVLFEKYSELVRLEVEEFGVKPTEIRHLLGRLGEFYCALQVAGRLSHVANQQGFDVICTRGRKISVKTTAQVTGFVPIKKTTMSLADDLMLVQYLDGALATVYYGPIAPAVAHARFYPHVNRYELDIAKARQLAGPKDSLPPPVMQIPSQPI
jgi:hypothetical protein